MRAIKFRAWSPLAREMYKVNSLHFDREGLSEIAVEVLEVDGVIYVSVVARDLELMQFTGLKDKHGKEVYEGDIVKGNLYSEFLLGIFSMPNSPNPQIYIVEYDTLARLSPFHLPVTDDGVPWMEALVDGFEVIGNIYENPDLTPVDESRKLGVAINWLPMREQPGGV